MSTSALKVEDIFPREVPSFRTPFPVVSARLESSLDEVRAVTDAYLKEREGVVSFFEADVHALEEIVTKFSLTGGEPKLDDLIAQAGEHLERTKTGILPQIDEALKIRRQIVVLKSSKAKGVLLPIIDRNLSLMRRYVKAMEAIYDRLIHLRDRSIQLSTAGLTEAAWAGLWDDGD